MMQYMPNPMMSGPMMQSDDRTGPIKGLCLSLHIQLQGPVILRRLSGEAAKKKPKKKDDKKEEKKGMKSGGGGGPPSEDPEGGDEDDEDEEPADEESVRSTSATSEIRLC